MRGSFLLPIFFCGKGVGEMLESFPTVRSPCLPCYTLARFGRKFQFNANLLFYFECLELLKIQIVDFSLIP